MGKSARHAGNRERERDVLKHRRVPGAYAPANEIRHFLPAGRLHIGHASGRVALTRGLVDSLNDDFTKLRGEKISRYNGQRIMRTKLAILEHNLPGEL